MDEIKGIRIVSLTGEKEYGIEDSEAREELANVVDGAPEELDSFKEAFEKFKEGGEALAGIAADVAAVGKAVTDEAGRAKAAEEELEVQIADEAARATAALAAEKTRAEQVEAGLDKKIAAEVGRAQQAEQALDDKITAEIDKIKDGDTIVGQAREIHSRNGKTVPDSFLVRTTAGSGTIGDGVASLKSVGGNIVKNLASLANFKEYNSNIVKNADIYKITRVGTNFGIIVAGAKLVTNHKYYTSYYIKGDAGKYALYIGDNVSSSEIIGKVWVLKSAVITYNGSGNYILLSSTDVNVNEFFVAKTINIDLTEMFGVGNEPDQATCDKLFGTMDALPQGLSIANPNEFKSTGFNQFNPDNVLEGKAIVDNAIVSGDKKIAVIPCLPCKVGVGENNGYCIHGDFGDDINVYLTPLNPKDVDGELYMHELTKDATTDTYVPLIKGYMLVEVPTTANLCAHFLWSEDKCERDSYEPYFESRVELPTIPQMSEWGLAGVQSSGTLVADEIDFERGVYVKRIEKVDWNTVNIAYTTYDDINVFELKNTGCKVTTKYAPSNAISDKYSQVNRGTVNSTYMKSGDMMLNINRIFIYDTNYTSVGTFRAAMQGVMLYYELATPEEYPLPKVDNNYISSDYGVEQFDSAVPCNANNLYYMRSLAGETRNFLDRMYDNTAKTDAKEVADYITNNLANKIPLATLENDGLMSAEDNKNLNTIIAFEFARVIGRTINPASGVFASVEGAGYLGVIPVKSGEKYLYSGRATQYNVGVAAYDENRAYLYPIICNVDNAVIKKDVCVDEPFTIPEGVAYIAVGTRYQESNPVSIKRVYSPKELADRKVPQLVSYDITDGYIVNTANGNVGAVAGSAVGSFIKVTEGEEFLITAKWGSQTGIAGYDKDKNYIIRLADSTLSTFYSAVEVSDYLIRIPQGVEYIRGCTTDAVNYPLKVVKLVSIEDLTEKIPLCQNQFSYAWFGDSISQYGLPENVERKLGSSILDCSFAGAPLTYSTEQYQGTGFMTIASCIKNGDYTPIENALQLQSGAGTDITEKLVNLQHIKDANWKAISHFVVMAGTNDLSFSGATIENIKAGLRQAFNDVISAYPHITIYFVSPPFRGNINSAAGNGLDLLEINEAIEEICKEFNFPFLDFFHNCGVNQYNKAYYLDAQELHPNANGLALWSTKLANWLKSI